MRLLVILRGPIGRLPARNLSAVFIDHIADLVLQVRSLDPVDHLMIQEAPETEHEGGQGDAGDHEDHRHPRLQVVGGQDREYPCQKQRHQNQEQTVSGFSQCSGIERECGQRVI